MPIKAVLRQNRKALAVESAALRFTDTIAAALAARLPQPPPPEPDGPVDPTESTPTEVLEFLRSADPPVPPDWVELQRYIAEQVEVARRRLLAAARERDREIIDDPRTRATRDGAMREAYDLLVRTRQALRAAVGDEETLALLGIEGKTPQQSDALLEVLRAGADRLRKVETDGVDLLLPGMPPDWGQLATDLDEGAEALETSLLAVEFGNRDAYGALRQRERVHAEIRDLVTGMAQVLEGLYRMAGRSDLGERIRPPVPTPSSEDDDAPPEPPAPPEPDGPPVDPGGPPSGGPPTGDGAPPADPAPPVVAVDVVVKDDD